MIWITKEQVLFLHSELIQATGGLDGLRDDNLLQSALLSPMQTYDGVELFPTLIDKAVRLACGLTQNHPFIDGNKRIGAHAMLVIFALNGVTLAYTQRELSDIFLQLAQGTIAFEGLRDWVYSHLANEKS
jgi:death-on-curing protein